MIAIIPSFLSSLSDSLLEIIPQLHQDIKPLQFNEVLVSLYRLVLSTLSLFFLPFTFIALLANGIPRIYGNLQLKKLANKFADKDQVPNAVFKKEIQKIVSKRLPGAIYYCLSGQITIWLISIFGTTSSIGQIGAISRFSMALTIFSSLISTLVVPRFSRLNNEGALLLKYYLRILFLLILLSLSIIWVTSSFASQLLWILGREYLTLNNALVFSIIGGCVNLLVTTTFLLSTSKGWILSPKISIPLNILTIIVGVIIFNVSSIMGILYLNITISAAQFLMLSAYLIYSIVKLKIKQN